MPPLELYVPPWNFISHFATLHPPLELYTPLWLLVPAMILVKKSPFLRVNLFHEVIPPLPSQRVIVYIFVQGDKGDTGSQGFKVRCM
jgi:hypothetical protein